MSTSLKGAIVIDSAALVAIALQEEERERIQATLLSKGTRLMSPISHLEAGLVLEARHGLAGALLLDELCRALKLDFVAFTRDHVRLARDAWSRFGKGRHPAGLNFGDCCTYALARATGQPLLCKGNDFPRTDLELIEY